MKLKTIYIFFLNSKELSLSEYTVLNYLYSGQTSICARFNIISTILTLSVSLPGWGHPDKGCPDHSDKVKDSEPEPTDDPCGGDSYTYNDNSRMPTQQTVTVDWDWFYCPQSKKCIHQIGRCNKIPHPECTFKSETTGETIAEDEVGCDYISKGLTSNSATYQCQSRSHNEKSDAVLSTVWNWTNGDFMPNQTVIPAGTIVNIKATRCDGVKECFDDSDDEAWCGKMELYETILIGKNLLTLSAFFFAFSAIYFFRRGLEMIFMARQRCLKVALQSNALR